MHVNKKILRLSAILVILVASSLLANPVQAVEVTEDVERQQHKLAHYYDLGSDFNIGIIYDAHDPLATGSAESMYYSLRLMTPNVKLLPVSSITELKFLLATQKLEIGMYIFPSTYDAFQMTKPNEKRIGVSWEKIAGILETHDDMHHIFAMGNTKQLLETMHYPSYVHGTGTETEDAKNLYIYGLWTLSDVLDKYYKGTAPQLAEDVKLATVQYFANNFNDLIQRNLSPANPMGIEAPETKQARKDRFYAEHPVKIERVPRDGYVVNPETNRLVNPQTGEPAPYVMDILSPDSITPTDFILNLIPEDSGLRGPIGGVVDELLGFLLNELGGLIGLSGDTVEALINVLTSIPDFIGVFTDPSASAIKGLLDSIKPLIPLPEDMMKYFDLIVDGLFLLRGDTEDIIGFVRTLIETILPDVGAGEDLVNTLLGVFDLTSTAITSIAEGDKIMDVIFRVLNEQILKDLLTESLGGEFSDTLDVILSTSTTIINVLSSGNYTKLIETFGDQLLGFLVTQIPGFSLSSSERTMIMTAVSGVLVATGLVEDMTLDDVLVQLLKLLFPSVDVAGIRSTIESLMTTIGSWVESPPSISTIKTEVFNKLSALGINTGTYEDAINAVEDIIVLFVAIKNDGFALDTATSLGSAVDNLLQQFGVTATDTINTVVDVFNSIMAVVNFIKNPPNLSKIISNFLSGLGNNMEAIITKLLEVIMGGLGHTTFNSELGVDALTPDAIPIIELIAPAISIIIDLVGNVGDNSFEGILMTLLQGGAYVISTLTDVDISAYVELAKGVFGTLLGYFDEPPSVDEVLADVQAVLGAVAPDIADIVEKVVNAIMLLRDLFTGGFKTIFAKLTEWIAGQVTQLIIKLTGGIGDVLDQEKWDLLNLEFPIEIGPFSLFTIKLSLGLKPGFEFNGEKFGQIIYDLIFKGYSIFNSDMDFGDILRKCFSFFTITPIFVAEIELSDFGSGENSFISFMLESLGVQLSFSGYGFFELLLFSFKNGVFNTDDFFKVIGWGFGFTLTISRTFTLLDFLTGGAGGSLNSIGKYIGLDAISITIAFTLGLDVVKRAATANKPETGSLTITLGIAFTVSLGIDILIASLVLTGTLAITLTLLQDLIEPVPMRVFISIELVITVTIGFLFWDWDFDYHWSPGGFSPDDPYELTPNSPQEAQEKGALGGDDDNDGLSNEYEINTPGLNKDSVDTDGDGLDDKFETQTLKTDASKKDTDDDGLDDKTEFNLKTNPLNPDTDFDGLNDYEEVVTIGTDALAFDTDQDGLDDYYEVHHSYNMTGPYFNVKEVIIGGVSYSDHTDPLNKDTDGDGLLDGEEGERGVYYGPELFDLSANEDDPNAEPVNYTPDGALIFNGGYTHPLSNDTDGDSYEQVYSGEISPRRRFLRDMSDYTEIFGIQVIYIDPETGEPETPVIVRTNPVNPDTDGDTGVKPEERENPPFGFFLNSDGYELALSPPTDPLDGDTDDDGLIDGYEGILRPDANHTDANNPDTDGDGLGDLQEFQLGSNPRSVDTDGDGVTDGDEFFVFGTSPFMADSDSDGLEDGEELWLYHSSPFLRDTDRDGLDDFAEVWMYFSDPADEDSDNDGLDDYEEIFIHYTDPFEVDTDGDGLFDGDEVLGLNYTVYDNASVAHIVTVYTDPTKADTDGDSLLTLDQDGEISQRMNDYDEWLLGTRPDRVDTDQDGIQDGWELWLGKGKIPDFKPVKIDPLDPDSDDDGLSDGAELHIANVTTLLYPYIGFFPQFTYNTRPDNNDTDGDFLSDSDELRFYFTNPANNDTDNDTLSDYEELVIYKTKPYKNDTDGDGLLDPTEINGYFFPVGHRSYDGNATVIFTDPNESDSDGDLLPDGAELFTYGYDPRDPDEDNDGIVDGMNIDTDGDGLQDGEEYYVYLTAEAAEGGGPFQPDSDRDGLFDGREVYETYTDPGNWDSDNDTYSDGLEVACGTNPNDNSTTLDDFQSCFDALARMLILSPAPYKEYQTNVIPVIIYDPDDSLNKAEFRYRLLNTTDWSPVQKMERDTTRPQDGYWKSKDSFQFPLQNGTYELEVTGFRPTEGNIVRTILFYVNVSPGQLEITSPEAGKTYEFNEFQDPKLPISVVAGQDYNKIEFQMYNESGYLITENTSLTYEGGLNAYHLSEYQFPDVAGKHLYTLQIFAYKIGGGVDSMAIDFYVKLPTILDTVIQYGGPVAAVGAGIMVVNVVRRRGFKNPFSKGGNN